MTEIALPEDIVIPDAVEPILGWKAVGLMQASPTTLVLMSLHDHAAWPMKKPFMAECRIQRHGYWRWTQSFGDLPRTTQEDVDRMLEEEKNRVAAPQSLGVTAVTLASSAVSSFAFTPAATFSYPPMPKTILVRGYWALHYYIPPHNTPGEDCSCGIYIADNFDLAAGYASQQPCVFMRVAGWGKVVPGTQGWRVEHAYPQEMFLIGGKDAEAEQLGKAYGVPCFAASSLPAVKKHIDDPRNDLKSPTDSSRCDSWDRRGQRCVLEPGHVEAHMSAPANGHVSFWDETLGLRIEHIEAVKKFPFQPVAAFTSLFALNLILYLLAGGIVNFVASVVCVVAALFFIVRWAR